MKKEELDVLLHWIEDNVDRISDAIADIIADLASAIANKESLRMWIARAIVMITGDVEKLRR